MAGTVKPAKQPALTELKSLEQACELLKTLAHAHRLRIVQMLLSGEYAVGELAVACGISPAMTSEHLRLMQHCGLLTSEKDSRKKYYHVAEPLLGDIMSIIEPGFCLPS